MLTQNLSSSSRFIRVVIGIALVFLSFALYDPIQYLLMFVIGLFGVATFLSGIMGWCPINASTGHSGVPNNLKKISKLELSEAVIGVKKGELIRKKTKPKSKKKSNK